VQLNSVLNVEDQHHTSTTQEAQVTTERSLEERYLTHVGGRVYASILRLRASKIIERALGTAGGGAARGDGDEVSEEIVVFGDSLDSGGGGVDIITLDPFMTDFHIIVKGGPILVPPPPPGGGGDTASDQCKDLAFALTSFRLVLISDELALDQLDEMIAAAQTREAKKLLREDKRRTEESIKTTKDAIKATEDEMARLGC